MPGAGGPLVPEPTSLVLDPSTPTSGAFGTSTDVGVTLTSNGTAVAGVSVQLAIGGTTRFATTDSSGHATASVPVNLTPGAYKASASFGGNSGLDGSSTSAPFQVTKSPTILTVSRNDTPTVTNGVVSTGLTVRLTDDQDRPLLQRTVYLTVDGAPSGQQTVAVITNLVGEASLGGLVLNSGDHAVTARFLGTVPFPSGVQTLTDSTYLASSTSATLHVDVPQIVTHVTVAAEGNSGSKTVLVPVELSHPSTETVTVHWATVDSDLPGQPTPGVDFEAASGTLVFAPGETSKTIPFVVYGDLLDEGPALNSEWGGIVFSSPTNATLGYWLNALALVVINDDDPPPIVKPGIAAVVEGDAGTTTVQVPVTLSAPSGLTVTVHWTTAATTQPEPGVDFEAASGTVTFLPGETSKTVAITVYGDVVPEPGALFGAEWGAITFTNPVNTKFGTGSLASTGLFLIVDDD